MDRLRHLWDFGDLDASEARLRDQLAQEPDDDGRAEVLTQLARVEGLRDEFDAAERLLVEAERLASSDIARARIDLERGRALRSSGDPDAAAPLFVAAYEGAVAAGQGYIAGDAAHMAAIVDPAWVEPALAFVESTEDARYWLGPLLNNLGWARFEEGDAAGALDAFERALAVRDTPAQRAIARYCVARALRELGRPAGAVEQLELAQTESPETDRYIEEELAAARADAHKLIFVSQTNYELAYAERPDVLQAWGVLNGAIKANMDLRRYELATLAAARRLKSSYCCLAHGTVLIERFDEPVREIALDHRSAGLDAVDVAVMDLAEKVVDDAAGIGEADIQPLRDLGLTDAEITDVVLAAAARCFFSKTLDGMRVLPDAKYNDLDAGLREALVVGRPIAEG